MRRSDWLIKLDVFFAVVLVMAIGFVVKEYNCTHCITGMCECCHGPWPGGEKLLRGSHATKRVADPADVAPAADPFDVSPSSSPAVNAK